MSGCDEENGDLPSDSMLIVIYQQKKEGSRDFLHYIENVVVISMSPQPFPDFLN